MSSFKQRKFLHVKMRISHRYGVEDFEMADYDKMNLRFKSGMNIRGKTRDYSGNEYAWVKVKGIWVLAYFDPKIQMVSSVYPKISTPCPGAEKPEPNQPMPLGHAISEYTDVSVEDLVELFDGNASAPESTRLTLSSSSRLLRDEGASALHILNSLCNIVKNTGGLDNAVSLKGRIKANDLSDALGFLRGLDKSQIDYVLDKLLPLLNSGSGVDAVQQIPNIVEDAKDHYQVAPAKIVRVINLKKKGATHANASTEARD